jgi:hypothetical protein
MPIDRQARKGLQELLPTHHRLFGATTRRATKGIDCSLPTARRQNAGMASTLHNARAINYAAADWYPHGEKRGAIDISTAPIMARPMVDDNPKSVAKLNA